MAVMEVTKEGGKVSERFDYIRCPGGYKRVCLLDDVLKKLWRWTRLSVGFHSVCLSAMTPTG
jgi:hypothetical protein